MLKSSIHTSLYLDIYPVRIKACDLIEEIMPKFLKHFGLFLSKDINKIQEIDIILSQLKEDNSNMQLEISKIHAPQHLGKSIKSIWICKNKDEIIVVIGYRGKADVIISLSDPIKIFYTPRKGCFTNLFPAILLSLHIVLYRKQGILFHGAVLCLKDTCVLLTGPGGVGKSIFVLNMLNEGWDYLSDDKFILYNKKAYIFRPYINISDYHYQNHPWLRRPTLNYKKAIRREWVRKRFQHFAENYFPNYFFQHFENYLSSSFAKQPKELFPDIKIIHTAEPKIWIVLQPGNRFSFIEVGEKQIIQDISNIQLLDFPEFDKLGRLLRLFGYGDHFKINKLVEANLKKDQKYYRVTVPYNPDVKHLYQNFKECLKQAS